MTDSMYPPRWGDINQLRARFGLSDKTVARLTQEDANFKRTKDGIVEYNFDTVLNHPTVQAFRENQQSAKVIALGYGVKTSTISYENLLKEE
jgi:hypothetical protein